MGEFLLQECAGCRARLFPDRLRCPACGGRAFRHVRAASGRVEVLTRQPGAEHAIATVSSRGATMIARVPVTAQPGDDIRLTDDPRDVDAAFVP